MNSSNFKLQIAKQSFRRKYSVSFFTFCISCVSCLPPVAYCLLLSACFLFFSSCSSEPSDDPIPFQPFEDIIINLTLPEFIDLQTDQGYKYLGGGVKGIIVYRVNATSFVAFERNCSFRPNDACATVEVHSSRLFMHDTCCDSTFDFKGEPTGGPAWRPLQRYRSYVNGSQLTITDEIVN